MSDDDIAKAREEQRETCRLRALQEYTVELPYRSRFAQVIAETALDSTPLANQIRELEAELNKAKGLLKERNREGERRVAEMVKEACLEATDGLCDGYCWDAVDDVDLNETLGGGE